MRSVIVLPGALLPAPIAPDILREAQAPVLSHLLALSGAVSEIAIDTDVPQLVEGAAHIPWLWNLFSQQRSLPVSAPYARAALQHAAPAADDGYWWQCTPCHFALARDRMLLQLLNDISTAESNDLFAEASACAAAMGATLEKLDQSHWFLRSDPQLLVEVPPLDAALGESVDEQMPRSESAQRWRKLLTEIQISWHALSLNEERESRGQLAVNAVWIYGGGSWQAFPSTRFGALRSDDAATRGWALAAGLAPKSIANSDVPFNRPDFDRTNGDLLLVRDSLFEDFKSDRWDLWLQTFSQLDREIETAWTQARAVGCEEIEIIATGRRSARRILVRNKDAWKRWRQWRRPPLSAWLHEGLAE